MDLKQVLAMGLGGTIGGGIFAALGVAIRVAGNGAVITFFVAGIVALLSGYSYSQLTDHLQEEGGSFTFFEHYFKNPNIAGFSGWVLIMGYIGTMALYAYAFGAFLSTVMPISTPEISRIIYSVFVIVLLVIINLQGTAISGTA
ncbi:MAG: amino acid permease, partial [Candidatus Heimdallarchaeota archaeon]|nr:amino acid permease [Candidatus Heimdallarchaeota archaeon]